MRCSSEVPTGTCNVHVLHTYLLNYISNIYGKGTPRRGVVTDLLASVKRVQTFSTRIVHPTSKSSCKAKPLPAGSGRADGVDQHGERGHWLSNGQVVGAALVCSWAVRQQAVSCLSSARRRSESPRKQACPCMVPMPGPERSSEVLKSLAAAPRHVNCRPCLTCLHRLQSELMSLMMSADPAISAFPDGDNIFQWTGTITGGSGTVCECLATCTQQGRHVLVPTQAAVFGIFPFPSVPLCGAGFSSLPPPSPGHSLHLAIAVTAPTGLRRVDIQTRAQIPHQLPLRGTTGDFYHPVLPSKC